jgi:hypothetical protein
MKFFETMPVPQKNRIVSVLRRVLRPNHADWCIRLLFWTAARRHEARMRLKFESHPDIVAIWARYEAARDHYRKVEATQDRAAAFIAAGPMEYWTDQYEARIAQLITEHDRRHA